MNEIDNFINYAIKNGFVDDSAVDWSEEKKRQYYQMSEAQN